MKQQITIAVIHNTQKLISAALISAFLVWWWVKQR